MMAAASVATLAALTIAGPANAQAVGETSDNQASPSPDARDADLPGSSDIVVTGTRVVRDGYDAPTPTTVLGAAELQAKAPNNLADLVNELPALVGSVTPRTTTSAIGRGRGGVNALNLRQLGPTRTLILLDGLRVGAVTSDGLVDINQLPQGLVERVDIVTGGASASWGSDAVAGVVNFILDKDFSGIKGEAVGGVTTYGDDRNYRLSLTAGTAFAGGRGHILISGEVAHNAGIRGIGSRDWYTARKVINNPAYTATNGQPRLLSDPNTGYAVATPGGIITSGPLRGTYFGPGGTPAQFNYGSIVSGNFMIGGQSQYADFGLKGDLMPRMSRQNAFARLSYDVTDDVQVFAQISYGRSTTDIFAVPPTNQGNITIRSDNAFIPGSIAARLGPLGITSFSFGTLNEDFGIVTNDSKRSNWRPVIGATGNFDALGSNWRWDISAQKNITDSYVESYTRNTANYNRAIDAVRNANGVIVCRSTLTNPNDGCVPYNVFGIGVNDQTAINYVSGTTWLKTRLTQDVAAANLRGEPFSTWAGPISVAMGIEHRREAVSGSNDPVPRTPAPFFAGNFLAYDGSYKVTEGYFETVVPLAKDASWARSLDFSGAIRATDYSTSGFVATWKLGLIYKPIDDITFRVTRSRDIRAPNLDELFLSAQSITTTIMDPFNSNSTATIAQVTSGNINLKPEKADTLGLGVVFRPRFLPGFSASVDYFNIDIDSAIASIGAGLLLNQCFAGNTALCSQIVRNGAGVLTQVNVQPINLSKQINRGIDFEASLSRPLLDGTLTLRALASHYLKFYTNNGINTPTDIVGSNFGGGLGFSSLPRWSYRASIGWDNERVSTLVTMRGFSSGVINTSWVECTSACPASTVDNMTVNNNYLPGATYFDAYVSYKVVPQAEIFFAVDNLANKDPAQVPWQTSAGGAPLSVNAALYDTLGRRFRAGLRFKL